MNWNHKTRGKWNHAIQSARIIEPVCHRLLMHILSPGSMTLVCLDAGMISRVMYGGLLPLLLAADDNLFSFFCSNLIHDRDPLLQLGAFRFTLYISQAFFSRGRRLPLA